MVNVGDLVKCLVFGAAVAILFGKHREIAAAIEAFKNNFPRGGPRTPMHPSPAGDDALLRHGSREPEDRT